MSAVAYLGPVVCAVVIAGVGFLLFQLQRRAPVWAKALLWIGIIICSLLALGVCSCFALVFFGEIQDELSKGISFLLPAVLAIATSGAAVFLFLLRKGKSLWQQSLLWIGICLCSLIAIESGGRFVLDLMTTR